uniref:AAA protein C-terminal winged helix domain-containing protein n=2 Tax=Kalmanozyma brasiliensis (strain GHG001) TaxID=1365824 RepID=V5GUS2_KALBG
MGASVGVLLLGGAAMVYHGWYKRHVLKKMEAAFDPGYDPVLALAKSGDQLAHVRIDPPRPEDEMIRSIISGKEAGRYFLVMGSKGSGKATSIIEAMAAIDADGCAFFDAHLDPTIVVDRFSESINFSNNRDYLGNLLGLSDLSGMSYYQQLERALHKLERALITRKQKTGKPAIIVMNSAHLLPRDDEGTKLLHIFQQRAEKWASAGTATFVFTSADYWVYDVLRKASNRMDTLSFRDLTRRQSINVLSGCRKQYWGEKPSSQDPRVLQEVYEICGGRLGLLNKVARRKDMLRAARQMVEDDMQWVLSKTGIIEDHDDDVMDEQKWSTCSWLLFCELSKKQKELEDLLDENGGRVPSFVNQDEVEDPQYSSLAAQLHTDAGWYKAKASPVPGLTRFTTAFLHRGDDDEDAKRGNRPAEDGDSPDDDDDDDEQDAHRRLTESPLTDPCMDTESDVRGADVPNPHLTWGEARQVMTRPDFIMELDHLNVIHIDRHHHIRADSMPLLRAMRRVAESQGYEERLESVMDRVSAIESLGRTRELLWKEQGDGGKFLIKKDGKGREVETWTLLGGDERLGRDTDEDDKDADD